MGCEDILTKNYFVEAKEEHNYPINATNSGEVYKELLEIEKKLKAQFWI